MQLAPLTFKSIRARAVVLKLKRPVVARIATITDWPLILIDLCTEAIDETCGKTHRLPSGPLHDAAEVARTGVPTVMMFVQSLHGISHNKIEDTKEEHLELCVTAFDRLAEKAMHFIA